MPDQTDQHGRSEGGGATPRRRAPFGRTVTALTALAGVAVSVQVFGWLDAARVCFMTASRSATSAGLLAATLLGVGMGALISGRLADRRRDPIRFLGFTHIILGAYTLVTPWVLKAGADLFLHLWRNGSLSGSVGVVGFTVGLLSLLPGMALVGALIPITMRVTTMVWSRLGQTLGFTAASWLAGLAVGALLIGFGAPQTVGLTVPSAVRTAGFLHLVLGAVGAVLSRYAEGIRKRGDAPSGGAGSRIRRRDRLSPTLRGVALSGGAAAGLAAAGFGLLLTPLLAAQLRDHPISLAVALAVAVFGAALGSDLLGRLIDHRRDRTLWVAAALTVAGVSSLWVAAALPAVARVVPALAFGVRSRPIGEVLTFVATVLPGAFCLGAAWPALCRVFVKALPKVGAHTGLMAAAWCAGGAVAAAAVRLVALPDVGCQQALLMCAFILSIVALALILVDYGLGLRRRVVALSIIVAVTAAATVPQPARVRHGEAAARGHPISFYREGPAAVVAVAQSRWRERWLIVNGLRIAGTPIPWSAPAAALAHVPLLIHPHPRQVLLLGYRAGGAVEQAALHKPDALDVVQPIDDVREAARRFRDAFAGPFAGTAAVTLHRVEPRGFVFGADRRYDVVIVNGTAPGRASGARAYSREFLLACWARARGDGIVALRVPTAEMDVDHLRLVVRTFRSVFAHAQLWWVPVQPMEMMLVGSSRPIVVPLGQMADRLGRGRVAPSLADVGGDDALGVASWLVMIDRALDGFAGPGPIETDRMPRLTASVARSTWARGVAPSALPRVLKALDDGRRASVEARAEAIRCGPDAPWPPADIRDALDRYDRSWHALVRAVMVEGDSVDLAYAAALVANPDDRCAYYLLVTQAGRERAAQVVRGLADRVGEAPGSRRALARLYLRLHMKDSAVEQMKQVVGAAPDEPAGWADLGATCLAADRLDAAETALTRALFLDPTRHRWRADLATVLMRRRKWRAAAAEWRRLADSDAGESSRRTAHVQIGVCLMEQGLARDATKHLEQANALFPNDPSVLKALGRAYGRTDRLADAVAALTRARSLAPDDGEALDLLRRFRGRLATRPSYPPAPPSP